MSLLAILIGFIAIRFLLSLPFYYRFSQELLKIAAVTSLAFAPLMTVLYHETDLNFFYLYLGIMLLDINIFHYLVRRDLMRAILACFFMDSVVFIYFFIGNG